MKNAFKEFGQIDNIRVPGKNFGFVAFTTHLAVTANTLTHVCTHDLAHTYEYAYTHVHAVSQVCTQTHSQAHTHVHTFSLTHTNTHTHAHTHIHTHARTSTSTHRRQVFKFSDLLPFCAVRGGWCIVGEHMYTTLTHTQTHTNGPACGSFAHHTNNEKRSRKKEWVGGLFANKCGRRYMIIYIDISYIYVYMHILVCVSGCVYTHVYTCTYTYVCVCVSMCVYTFTYTHSLTHTHTHVQTQTYTHMRARKERESGRVFRATGTVASLGIFN